jgi:protease-4
MIGILSYKTWLIEPQFAARMAPIIMRYIEQGTLDKFINQNKQENTNLVSSLYGGISAEYSWVPDGPSYYIATTAAKKKVAIVAFMGSITKNGESCSFGMRDYENTLATIERDDRVSGVVLHFNNAPGGSHDGTPEISEMISKMKKSTVAFVDGYAASAHYFMASQCKHIMMNVKTDSKVGSIGSLIITENIQNMVDAGTFPKVEIIRAPQSVNKALMNYVEPLTDKLRAELNEDLRICVDGFIASVKAGRGAALKDDGLMFTGKMYGTDDAIANGLADSKGSLQDAINKAGQPTMVANPVSSNSKVNSNSINKPSMKIPKMSSFFKKKAIASAEGDTPPAEDTTPRWTDTMVFNTDGSGDGAFCLQADADGKDRKFETKVDNNTGNEPPTDPAVTEDDNWSVVAEAASPDGAEANAKKDAIAEPKIETSVMKLNAALKLSLDQLKVSAAEIAVLKKSEATLQAEVKTLNEKLAAEPAGHATTVVMDGDPDTQEDEAPKTDTGKEAVRYSAAMNDNFL